MNKIILKTALITLASLIVGTLMVFSLWILCSPQSMASACEKTGNYSFAVTCADLRFKYTKNAGDLARCAEDGILSGKDKHIIAYGEKLVSHEKYAELCAKKDEKLSQSQYGKYTLSYNSYIRGHLSSAQYRAGETDKAIQTAVGGGARSFNKLVIEIAEKQDAQTAQKVLKAFETHSIPEVDDLKTILLNIN